MIPFLRGWSRTTSGDAITLYPPEGAASGIGAIRYRERVRPLSRASAIVEQLLARYPIFQATRVGAPEPLVTAEGEYAALVQIEGTVNGAPAQRDLGLVFGDDFHAQISAICLRPDRMEDFARHVRLLTVMDSHVLGVRRRRFLYQPPPGWQGLPRGAVTVWMPPDYPANHAFIEVYPANPRGGAPEVVLQSMLAADADAGHVVDAMTGPEEIGSSHGLTGSAWNLVGGRAGQPRSHRDLVVLRDARYAYPMRLETAREDRRVERQLFLDLVRSAQPIPEGGAQPPPAEVDSLVGHWTL